ncbi:MAG: HEAT repeat domain-containing protein [Dissulfuribacterales bacterium]
MKRFPLKQGLCIALFALPLLVTSHLMAQNRIPFSKEKLTKIPSISNDTGEGEVSIEAGQKSDTLKIAVAGKAKVHSDKYFCLFCLDTVRIAKNLRIPTTIFMEKTFDDLKGIKTLESGVFRTHFQLETVTAEGKKYTKIKEPHVRDQIESDIVLEVPVEANASEFIVSGPQGARLKKEGKGFFLAQGEAYFLEPTEKPTKVRPESPLSIRLSTGVPDGAKGKMELKVLTGKYKLKSGTELWTGSKVFVSEDLLTFPLGLTIHVGKGGVTLRGKSYPEGTTLTIGKGGLFHSNMIPVSGHSGKPAKEELKEQKKTVRIIVEQIYTAKHDSIEKLEENLLPFESLSKKLLSHCGDLIIVGSKANKYDYTLKIRTRGEALGAFYSPMGMGKGTYRYTGACVSGSTTLEGIDGSTYEIPFFYGRIRPVSQINMPDSRTSLYYAPFEDALRQSSFILDLIDLLAEEFGTPFLLDCLKDEDRAIREEAGLALSGMGTSAVEPLIEALKTRHSKIRKNAAKILGNTRDSRALEPLISTLNDEDVEVRRTVTTALGKMKDQRAIEPLMAALMDEDRIVRINAALALEKMGTSAVEPLIEALKSENRNVRVGAAKVLERITYQSFGKNYEAWSRWWQEKKKRDTN